jgi:hypothetical protein
MRSLSALVIYMSSKIRTVAMLVILYCNILLHCVDLTLCSTFAVCVQLRLIFTRLLFFNSNKNNITAEQQIPSILSITITCTPDDGQFRVKHLVIYNIDGKKWNTESDSCL